MSERCAVGCRLVRILLGSLSIAPDWLLLSVSPYRVHRLILFMQQFGRFRSKGSTNDSKSFKQVAGMRIVPLSERYSMNLRMRPSPRVTSDRAFRELTEGSRDLFKARRIPDVRLHLFKSTRFCSNLLDMHLERCNNSSMRYWSLSAV